MEDLERQLVEVQQKVITLDAFDQDMKQLLFGNDGLAAVVIRIDQRMEAVESFCKTLKTGVGKIVVAFIVSGVLSLVGAVWYLGR